MPEQVVFEAAMRLAFAGHRLSSNIIGSPRSVNRMTRDQLRDYFQWRYSPSNIVLFACGKIDELALLNQVDTLWSTRRGPRVGDNRITPIFHVSKKMIVKKEVSRQHVVVLWPSISLSETGSLAASILGSIYGEEQNSRLYWALRHTGLAEDVSGGYSGFSDTGIFSAQVACDPDQATHVLDIVQQEAFRLKKGIRKSEFQRVKNRARAALVFSAETPFNRFRQLMQGWLERRELLSIDEMLSRIEATTIRDLYQVLERFPLDEKYVVTRLGPPPVHR
jgi:predicted Zn-dependent peptidase